jgi:glycerol kinase
LKKILAVDQGTTSTKALVVGEDGTTLGTSWPARFAIKSNHPQPGWVEYDPDQILETVCESARAAAAHAGVDSAEITGIGLANQGETVVAFNSKTGRPVYPAISWQDRRGEEYIAQWLREGLEETVIAVTGLRLDAYFSAAKLAWILNNVPQAQTLLADGVLCFGTLDSWLIWQLSRERRFVTDAATASRTMLVDLATCQWSLPVASACQLPLETLPEIVANAVPVGVSDKALLGSEIPITGLCVDQPAGLFGRLAFDVGQTKITYGTGCFVLANTGRESSTRAAGLLTSVGWQYSGSTTFVFDGGVYSAGSLVDWMCRLGLVANVAEISEHAHDADQSQQVFLIPALGGLAAPHWRGRTRACWVGMDHSTNRSHLVRSALEAIAFRVKEICDAMADAGVSLREVHVDGGLAQCDWLMQIQADVLHVPLRRSAMSEFTALGIGYLAGLGAGVWSALDELPRCSGAEQLFEPSSKCADYYQEKFEKWKQVCGAAIAMGEEGLFDA